MRKSKTAILAFAIISGNLLAGAAVADEKLKPFTIKGNDQQALSNGNPPPGSNSSVANEFRRDVDSKGRPSVVAKPANGSTSGTHSSLSPK